MIPVIEEPIDTDENDLIDHQRNSKQKNQLQYNDMVKDVAIIKSLGINETDIQQQSNNDESEKYNEVKHEEVEFDAMSNPSVNRQGVYFQSCLEPDKFGLKSEKASKRSASR